MELFIKEGFVVLLDKEDYEIVKHFKWHLLKIKLKTRCNYYAVQSVWENNRVKNTLMHRFIMKDYLILPKQTVDHVDGNGLNNRRNNLRIATHSQNIANQRKTHGISSKFKGVFFDDSNYHHNSPWKVRIGFNNKKIYVGNYKYEEDAAIAYNLKALELFGEFASLNII